MNTSPSRAALITLSALVCVLAVLVCVLYALTPDGDKAGLLGKLAVVIGGAVAGIPAVLGALTGRQLVRDVEVVKHQTNGALKVAVADVVAQQLREHGLSPNRRASDPAPAPLADGPGEVSADGTSVTVPASSVVTPPAPVVDDGSAWWAPSTDPVLEVG